MSLFFSGKRVQNEINSDFANRMKIQGINFLNVPNLSFKREQSESCFDSAERVINQKQNVPNLRFPEFTGEYEKYNLGELGSTLIGLTYSPADVVSEGGTIVLRSSNIKNGVTNYDDIVRVNKKIKDSIITRTNDILVCARNGSPRLIGKNAILKESDSNITFGAFMMIYRSNDNTYIHQLLSTKRFYSQVGENLGARINQITTSDFNSFEFYFPKSKEERIKIASLLALIDKRIETQNKIIQQLQSLIKGIYDKVFEDISDYQKLSSVCTIQKGQQVNGEELSELGDYYVMNGGIEPSGYYDRYNTYANTISISEGGNSCGYVQYNNVPFWSSGHCYTLQNIKEGYHNLFLYHYLKAREKEIMALRIGSGLPNIQKKDLEKFIVPILPLETQVGIADGINKIETKLKQEKDILSAYQKQKAYLLRNLFI